MNPGGHTLSGSSSLSNRQDVLIRDTCCNKESIRGIADTLKIVSLQLTFNTPHLSSRPSAFSHLLNTQYTSVDFTLQ